MVDDSQLIQVFINCGGLAIALYLLAKKIEDLQEDIRELNRTLKDILLKLSTKQHI
jgi:hypothetical protein